MFNPTDITSKGELVGYAFESKERRGLAAVMPASGGSLKLLPEFPLISSNLYTLRVSPDETGLTYVEQKDGRFEVWQKPFNGGPAHQLTNSEGDQVFAYAWSPEGNKLAVARGRTESDVVLIHRK